MPVPPKKNSAYIIYTGLIDQSNTKLLKSTPTIAAGDFKVVTDGAASANLGTLPTNTPGGVFVKISLSAAEMNGDNITVSCIDVAGAEWCDQLINIQTAIRTVDDLAFPATSGRSMVIDVSGLVDANAVKLGPTGAGTAQTARDVGATLGAAGAGLTALGDTRIANLDATISSRLAPAGTLATVTALTNAPTAGDFTATMKTSLNAATPAVTVSDKTGFSLSVAGILAIWHQLVSTVVTASTMGKLIVDYLDAAISTRTKPADTQAAVTNLTNAPTVGDLTAVMKTSVQTAIAAELDAADIELAAIPTVTSSLRLKLKATWQYLLLKRATTATTETMYKNDGSTSLGTSTVSNDGTTATHGKVS